MTTFGIITWAETTEPLKVVAETAKAAEDNGFSNLWIWDTSHNTDKEAYIALTLAALSTQHLRLGPGVSTPLSRHLSIAANAIASLDDVSGGRAVLGYGAGGMGSARAMGYPQRRMVEFREDLVNLRGLLDAKEAMVQNTSGNVASNRSGRIPIYLAAGRPRMLQLTGELADGALIAGSSQKEFVADKIRHVHEGVEIAGRDKSEVKINIQMTVSCHSDRQVAINEIKPIVAYQAIRNRPQELMSAEHSEALRKMREQLNHYGSPSGFGSGVYDLVPDSMVNNFGIAGTEEECQEYLSDILSLQPDELTFRVMSGDRRDLLKRLGSLISKLS